MASAKLTFEDLTEESKKIVKGFKINWMKLKDAETKTVLWECDEWDTNNAERSEKFPVSMLSCPAVTREINFTSEQQISELKLEQRIYLGDDLIEKWIFEFGFVIPQSTNTWEQTIYAAEKDEMIPPEILSGNTVIETVFINKNEAICISKLRVYYE